MLCWRTSFLITSAGVRGSGQRSGGRKNLRKFTKLRCVTESLCAAGGWRGCWRPLWASQRMSSWKIGVNIRTEWHPGFLVFFCDFNNSQPLASLLGRQNTCFFELWCRRDAFFENRNRYGSIPVAMSKKKWPPFVTFWHRNRYGSRPRAIDFAFLHTLHDFCDLEI